MNGKSKPTEPTGERAAKESLAAAPAVRKSAVAKVSHTLSVELAERLEAFAFFQRVSESAVIEHSLQQFFGQGDDMSLGDVLRRGGAGRRRKL
jgi:hypothetical protein